MKLRPVPLHIPRPEYADTGRPAPRDPAPPVVGPELAQRLRRAGQAAHEVLEHVVAAVRPGVTTDELDVLAHEAILARGAYPSPLNYMGYPKSLCTSVNEVICHGIPDHRRLEQGDIVNCDVTLFLDGVHGDTSVTVPVGEIDAESRRLIDVTREAMLLGIAAARVGGAVGDVGRAIEAHARSHGLGVVREFVGHGIGERFHTAPHVPHYAEPTAVTPLVEGMVFTVEPMLTLGDHRPVLWDDGWTAVTADGRRSAQFEHTVLLTARGPELLTVPAGGAQPFLS